MIDKVNIQTPQTKGTSKQRHNVWKIAYFNVQKTRLFDQLIRLASKYDILSIQEFTSKESHILELQEYCLQTDLEFFSHAQGPTTATTGIFMNSQNATLLGANELSGQMIRQGHSTDIRFQSPNDEMILAINLYRPSRDKPVQVEILTELLDLIPEFLVLHPELKFVFGGDMNHRRGRNPASQKKKAGSSTTPTPELLHPVGSSDLPLEDQKTTYQPSHKPTTGFQQEN